MREIASHVYEAGVPLESARPFKVDISCIKVELSVSFFLSLKERLAYGCTQCFRVLHDLLPPYRQLLVQ